MTVRLGFAVAAHLEPDILLVDEVLAVGDEGFQTKCLNKIGDLKKKGVGIILVSHNMHTISTFAGRVILMNNGKYVEYGNVSEGIKEYRRLFFNDYDTDIQKVCSGNDKIRFFEVKLSNQILSPGNSFSISMKYESKVDYKDVEIDVTIYSSNENRLHFQATNKAFDKVVDLKKGEHIFRLKIENIQICNALAKVVVAIWSKDRGEYLFWWRIPVTFEGITHSTGKNFLKVCYELD